MLRGVTSERERVAEGGSIEDGPFTAGPWHQWGPYLAERAWGTVREDYSPGGDAWSFFPYEHARSRAYRWNEDGMAGISDIHQDLCLALALWNGRDDHLKERMFGLTGPQGNHGEDAKEYWWYLDATPSHSLLRWRYHYPQAAFPYEQLTTENARRSRHDPEYELLDTGVFDHDGYWVVEVTYAKDTPTDILMRIQVTNMSDRTERLHVLPTLWFRNTWSWGHTHRPPSIELESGRLVARHSRLGTYELLAAADPDGAAPVPLFCQNSTNVSRLFGADPVTAYPKDGINDHVVSGAATVDPQQRGTKAAWWYQVDVPAGQTVELRLELSAVATPQPQPRPEWQASTFDAVLAARQNEADAFYADLAPSGLGTDERALMRQAFAGMIWGKQFYHYDVSTWLDGDPGQPVPPSQRNAGRNCTWRTLDAYDVISMPDPWEYPWFAAWDLAFHAVTLAFVDPEFAKYQLLLMLREWYSHANGAMPSYEWNFGDVNPPVHAWAALAVYAIDGEADRTFLVRAFTKLLMNFTWWMNRIDPDGNNVFEGGFLGLDNIGPVDRSNLPPGYRLEQSDGTGWMAFYSLLMLRISLTLAEEDAAYEDLALRFFEHFALIARGITAAGMWDPSDGFFYDQLLYPDGHREPIRVRSLVGVLPVLATAFLDGAALRRSERLQRAFADFMRRHDITSDTLDEIGVIADPSHGQRGLLALVDPERLRRILAELLDENGMLAPTGIRSLSKRHRDEPVSVVTDGVTNAVWYEPAESSTPMYGGNSNWRGPVWFPLNVLIVDALERFHRFLGEEYTVEMPTGSGQPYTLTEVAAELRRRLVSTFLPGPDGRRPVFGGVERFQTDPRWNDALLFYEYFNGDDGAGLGASHQTGWTGLVATLLAVPPQGIGRFLVSPSVQ
jgi:hypothetical protein